MTEGQAQNVATVAGEGLPFDWETPTLFIAGASAQPHSSETTALVSSVTERQFGRAADADEVDVQRAVEAARAALPAWSATSAADRGALLDRLADRYEARLEDMARLVTQQNGAAISRSLLVNGSFPVKIYRRAAEQARAFEIERPVESRAARSLVRDEPVGVAGLIVPWNAPQVLLAKKLARAVVAGCTTVIKPSPETPADSIVLAAMATDAGFPDGVINVVPGGRETGELIVGHPGVDKVSFTGSTAAGRSIGSRCGGMLKPFTAELGGKSAAVLLEDADLELFTQRLVTLCLPNSGQVCHACTRILAPRSRFDEVLDAVVDVLEAASVGDPFDPSTDFGPLVSERQRARVEDYIQSGREDGARIVLGGGRPPSQSVGYFVQPTVFVDARPDMRIVREEIFGPVLVVMAFDDDDDAVRLANDTSYGLGGTVFSEDIPRAVALARRLETGQIGINGAPGAAGARHYGFKDSGAGGDAGVVAYTQAKSINLPVKALR